MSDIQVTSIDGNQINVTTGLVVGPLPSLQLAAGDGITITSGGGVSTISANLSELSIPANLADLGDVSAGSTSGQVLSYDGTSWTGLTLSIPANLADLLNVQGTPTAGQVLAWDGASWAPADDQTGGSSNVANLADLGDVSGTAPATGQALVWSGSEWAGGTIPPGTTVNGLSGAVNLVSGENVTITADGQNLTIASVGGGAGVSAVNGLSGNISLIPGDNINISQSGQNVSIAANGGLYWVESPTLSIDSSLDDNGNLTLDVAWPTAPFGVFATNRSPGEVLVRWQEPIPRRLRYYVEYEVAQPPNAPTISNLSVTADGLIGNITSDDDADLVEIQYSADGTTFI